MLLLADDWFDKLKSGVSALAPHVLPFVKDAVRNFAPSVYDSV